jgi:lysophospholipase L1-like esterase
MLEEVRSAAGKFETRSFLVNLRSINLAGGKVIKLKERELTNPHWDNKLTLEFNNNRPCLCALSVEKVDDALTVFLAGDSTVTDQPFEPWNSWGAMLPRFLGPDVAVANFAESGESTGSFLGARRFDKIMATMRKGDYLFIQFGHNDMKDTAPNALTGYKDRMRKMLTQFRDKGGIPVLVTSVQRRSFDKPGKEITNSLGDYPETVRKLAEEEKVALIDLHAMTKTFYEALGAEGSKKAFVDSTHHTSYGGYETARCVVEGIRKARLGLAEKLAPDAGTFDPAHPDPVAAFKIPVSPQRDPARPEGD